MTETKPPRFNHVAMSLSADQLDEEHRAELLAFYGEVFGWEEAPGMTIDRERLVFLCHRYDQFVFLVADDHPMTARRMDHFGQAVASRADLDDIYQRASAWAARDDRVDLVDLSVDEFPGVRLHAFYVRFGLPLMIETQWWEWTGTP